MSVLRLRPDAVEWKEIDGEIVALEADTSTYLAANPSGAVLWQALAVGATRDQLANALASRYGISTETAAGDVDAFVSQLSARGLLESG